MIDNIFLERVAYLVDEVHMDIGIVGIYLAAAFINGQKYRLYTTRSLCHQRGRTRRSNGQTGYIASSVLYHILVQLLVGLLQTQDKGILSLALGIINLKGATFPGHLDTRAISVQRQCLVNLYAEVGSFLSTIAQSHGCYHVTFGSNTHTRTAALRALSLNLFPQMHLGTLYLHRLGIALHLLHDEVNLFQFQVHNVIHQALGHPYMLLEQLVVEIGILGEGILHVTIQIDAQQTA